MRGPGFIHFSLLAVVLAAAPEAHAVKGAYLGDSEFPANVCKIDFYPRSGGSGDPRLVCSGTLIARNRVITAAHCDANLDNYPEAYVRCGRNSGIGGRNMGTMVKGHIRTPWYTPEGKLHDLAVLELDSGMNGPYVSIVESLQQSTDLQAHLEACRLYGFGRDNYNRLGASHVAQFQPRSDVVQALSIVTGPNRAARGDSGGPVLCPVTTNGTTQWVQIAVTISIPADQSRQLSFHELLDSHLEWFRGVQAMPNLPKIENR